MAEGNWYYFHKGLRAVLAGDVEYSTSGKWSMRLLADGSTPDLDTSTCASLSFNTTAGAGDSASRDVANVRITASASTNWKITHDAVAFTASSGQNWSSMYAVMFYSAVDQPIHIFQMSTSQVVATQITVNPPAGGVHEFSASYTLA